MRPSETVDRAFEALAELPAHKKAGFAASLLVAALCARSGVRFIPAMAIATAAGMAAEKLYVVVDDLHQVALAQRDYLAVAQGVAEAQREAIGHAARQA